jgi:hypothetical protein
MSHLGWRGVGSLTTPHTPTGDGVTAPPPPQKHTQIYTHLGSQSSCLPAAVHQTPPTPARSSLPPPLPTPRTPDMCSPPPPTCVWVPHPPTHTWAASHLVCQHQCIKHTQVPGVDRWLLLDVCNARGWAAHSSLQHPLPGTDIKGSFGNLQTAHINTLFTPLHTSHNGLIGGAALYITASDNVDSAPTKSRLFGPSLGHGQLQPACTTEALPSNVVFCTADVGR